MYVLTAGTGETGTVSRVGVLTLAPCRGCASRVGGGASVRSGTRVGGVTVVLIACSTSPSVPRVVLETGRGFTVRPAWKGIIW